MIPGWGKSPGEGNGNPLQYSCRGNPMDRGTWWATIYGVAKSRTRLSDFTSLWLINDTKTAEVDWFCEDLQDLLELISKKRCPFHHRGLECKIGCQKIPGLTGKFGLEIQNKARQRLTEFCQENSLVVANTLFQQHKRRLYTWTSPDGQY